ncbi:H-2 class II histocompatibility antigen, A-K beta chain-like [Astatotilapia calliptera]|uniref:H-2 class II histocompatibility antigen, A-K beta chain-like n=1 Tax=Astatotilapia calliptera TaxID=8154 RepID=UPI000E418321|nr:H-2 class II histocompatibility antigen, A-K beta chain-like [Astatotilapia calliptera]
MSVWFLVQPSVRIKSKTPLSGHHPAMLVCSVYDFFPRKIKVSWLRDGQKVTSDVTSTQEMPNGDWYYQTHSQLEYTPRSGENISCVVEHASLKEPLITDWGKYLSVTLRLDPQLAQLAVHLRHLLPLDGRHVGRNLGQLLPFMALLWTHQAASWYSAPVWCE